MWVVRFFVCFDRLICFFCFSIGWFLSMFVIVVKISGKMLKMIKKRNSRCCR